MRRLLLDISVVLVGAILLLLIAGQFANLRRWHTNGWGGVLNDSVGYVSVARNLVDNGTLSSNVIYTSTLKQKPKRNYLYMPGQYLALAASFALAGVGPVQAVLPSLVAYCIACGCVFLTTRRLYGRRAAFIAAALFAFFPPSLAFSFTAMAELTLLAAVSIAFCIFVYLPERLRPVVGPVLLILPFCFRETTALLVIPMTGLILGGMPLLQRLERNRWRAAIVFCTLTVVVLACVYEAPFSRGRPSLMKGNIFNIGGMALYHDATALDQVPSGLGDWMKAIKSKVVANWGDLKQIPASRPYGLELVGLAAISLLTLLALVAGWRRQAVLFSSGMMVLVMMIMVFALYTSDGHRGLRSLMFVWPMLAISAAWWLDRSLTAYGVQWSVWCRIMGLMLALVATASVVLACFAIRDISGDDAIDDERLALLESIKHDPARMLLSPYWIGLQYVEPHHPVKWGFLPLNRQTLSLLKSKYDIGTLVVPPHSTKLTPHEIQQAGFVLDQTIGGKARIAVYKNQSGRAQVPGPTSRASK